MDHIQISSYTHSSILQAVLSSMINPNPNLLSKKITFLGLQRFSRILCTVMNPSSNGNSALS